MFAIFFFFLSVAAEKQLVTKQLQQIQHEVYLIIESLSLHSQLTSALFLATAKKRFLGKLENPNEHTMYLKQDTVSFSPQRARSLEDTHRQLTKKEITFNNTEVDTFSLEAFTTC